MNLKFREARESDISALVVLLADDELGANREDLSDPLNHRYADAFQCIEKDPNNVSIDIYSVFNSYRFMALFN